MKRIISLLLILCLLFSVAGCGDNKTAQSGSLSDPSGGITKTVNLSAKEVLDEILTQEEQQNYSDIMLGLKFFNPKYTAGGNCCYHEAPEQHTTLFSLGIKGLPMLIYETAYHNSYTEEPHSTADGAISHGHFQNAIIRMLRVDELASFDIKSDTQNPHRDDFYSFFKDAKVNCPQIIKSSIDTNAKITKLRKYGMLAIPYVKEEIDKGDLSLESYFREIGIHLATEEFSEIVCSYRDYAFNEYDEQLREKVYNHPKAEGFDYKVWLSENKEDLNNLFKFLDAYCGEYEAEMAEE